MSRAIRKKKKQKNLMRELATQRMWRLFELAEQEFGEHPERSKRYVQLIRGISMRNRIRAPGYIKRRICKHCYAFLVPGKNARYRLKDGILIISCETCGKEMRYPFKPIKAKKSDERVLKGKEKGVEAPSTQKR